MKNLSLLLIFLFVNTNNLFAQDVYGCTSNWADNYNELATIDDGSCFYSPCEDANACNYMELALGIDESQIQMYENEDNVEYHLYSPEVFNTDIIHTFNIEINSFADGQTLSDVNEISKVFVNIEHSYIGELSISLTSPDGIEVQLFDQVGGSYWFGSAIDDEGSTQQGVPEIYNWSPNPSYNGTMNDAINNSYVMENTQGYQISSSVTGLMLTPDSYYPIGDFNDFIGTTLNGVWTLTIIDNLGLDDGWLFTWGIDMLNADNDNCNYPIPGTYCDGDSVVYGCFDEMADNYNENATEEGDCIYCDDSMSVSFNVINGGECEYYISGLGVIECDEFIEVEGQTTDFTGFNNSVYYSFEVEFDSELLINLDAFEPDYSGMYKPYVLLFDSARNYIETIEYTQINYINDYNTSLVSGFYYMVVTDGNPNFDTGTLYDYFLEIENNFQNSGTFLMSLLISNGDCNFIGCTLPTACNYDEDAIQDDGSCIEAELYYDCGGNCLFDINDNGICDELELEGCIDETAVNYDEFASVDDGSCEYIIDDTICQQIDFPTGWYIFSTYVLADDMNVSTIMSSIDDDIIVLKNNVGFAYLPQWDFNGVGDLNPLEGYLIKTISENQIEICGEQLLPEEHSIILESGWNIISYLRTEPASVDLVLEDINVNIQVVKDYNGFAYLPQWDFNGIGNMMPGQGYQIKVNESDTIYYLPNNMEY